MSCWCFTFAFFGTQESSRPSTFSSSGFAPTRVVVRSSVVAKALRKLGGRILYFRRRMSVVIILSVHTAYVQIDRSGYV